MRLRNGTNSNDVKSPEGHCSCLKPV